MNFFHEQNLTDPEEKNEVINVFTQTDPIQSYPMIPDKDWHSPQNNKAS